ncbi:MAG: sulfotransferase family protein [Candidatus Helarchaeota archaeon]
MPNFFLVGVEKSATTWIYNCLKEHPEIFLPPFRSEVHFFDRNYDKGIEFYRKFYKSCKNEIAIGDITPSYMYNNEIAERIVSHFPKAKIIFSLRNPVDRCYSHYLHLKRNRNLNISFSSMVRKEDFLNKSLYYAKVKTYFDLFPRENILILLFEKIKENPQAFLKKIFRFLEVDENFTPSNLNKRDNIYVTPRNIKAYRFLMLILRVLRHKHNKKIDILIEIVKKIGLKQIISKKSIKNQLPFKEREELFDYFKKDIKELSDLVRINLFNYWHL